MATSSGDRLNAGGQHAKPIGISTKDITDHEDMQQRLQDFNNAQQRYSHPKQDIGDHWANAELERYGAQCGWEW